MKMAPNEIVTLQVPHMRRSLIEGQAEEEDLQSTLMTLKLKFLHSNVNLTQMSSFSG